MSDSSRQAYYESADDSSAQGSEPDSSSSYPKKGTTRIPSRLVSARAILDLQYPFFIDGKTTIINRALGQGNIDELLQLSQQYLEADAGIENYLQPETRPEIINVGVEPTAVKSSVPSSQVDQSTGVQEPAIRRFKPNEEVGEQPLLSGIVNLKSHPGDWPEKIPTDYLTEAGKAWKGPKTLLSTCSAVAELLTIHSAEYYMDETGQHKLILCCPEGPLNVEQDSSLVKMRWLHLHGHPTTLRTLEDLVTECPFLKQPLRSVALSVLLDVSKRGTQSSREESYVQPGTLVRSVGRYKTTLGRYDNDPFHDTEPVIFTSSPYLALANTKTMPGEMLLPELQYNYDVAVHRFHAFGAQELHLPGYSKSLTLRVPQLWSLVIGSDVLITFGNLSLREILADNVIHDTKPMGSNFGVFTVRLIEEVQMCRHHIVIDRDCNFISFTRLVALLARSDDTNERTEPCVLVDVDGFEVTPQVWVELLESGAIESRIFGLVRKSKVGSALSDDFRALIHRRPDPETQSKGTRPLSFQSTNTSMEVLFNAPNSLDLALPSAIDQDDQDESNPSWPTANDWDGGEDISVAAPADNAMPLTIRRQKVMPSLRHQTPLTQSDMFSQLPIARRPDLRHIPQLFRLYNTTAAQQGQSTQASFNSLPDTGISPPHIDPGRLLEAPPEGHVEELPLGSERASLKSSEKASSVKASSLNSPVQDVLPETHKTNDNDSDEGSGLGLNGAGTLQVVPFLTWRLSWEADERTPEGLDQSLIQLLNMINTGLLGGGLGKYHRSCYQCTEEDLATRVKVLTGTSDTDNMLPAASRVSSWAKGKTRILDDKSGPSDVPRNREGAREREQTPLRVLEMLGLFRDIMDHFLPRHGSASIHPVCIRFWGALDALLRQHYLSGFQYKRLRGARWVVAAEHMPRRHEDMGRHTSGKTHPSQCQKCLGQHEYLSPEKAIAHLHKHHMPCQPIANPADLADDICVGWIRSNEWEQSKDLRDGKSQIPGFDEILQSFVATLSGISEKTRSIHFSLSGSETQNQATNLRPHLLSSLVHAFEKILDLVILQATGLTWINRAIASSVDQHTLRQYLDSLQMRSRAIDGEIQENLRVAKRDVFILGTTQRNANRLITASVSAEFLLTYLIINTQRNALIRGTDRKLDAMKHFQGLTNALHFKSRYSPKRQRFIDISALEENLSGLQLLVLKQKRLLAALEKMLMPASFPTATTEWTVLKARSSLFRFESQYISGRMQALSREMETLGALQRRTHALRHDVKQSIEILEEGHGKAIRVFTIVTLFFLPLSFVSSFFGMNTVDVRETSHSQTMFWTAALPITSLVITAALLYGYKWDETVKYASQWLSRDGGSLAHLSPIAIDNTTLVSQENKPTQKESRTDINNTDTKDDGHGIKIERDKEQQSRSLYRGLRWPRKAGQGGITRRKTGDSLFVQQMPPKPS